MKKYTQDIIKALSPSKALKKDLTLTTSSERKNKEIEFLFSGFIKMNLSVLKIFALKFEYKMAAIEPTFGNTFFKNKYILDVKRFTSSPTVFFFECWVAFSSGKLGLK